MQTAPHQRFYGTVDSFFFYQFSQFLAELKEEGILIVTGHEHAMIENYMIAQSKFFADFKQYGIYEVFMQLYINYCKLIAKFNLTDFYGLVWRSKNLHDGKPIKGGFYLGIGTVSDIQIRYWLPINKWEECYFAEELEYSPEGGDVSCNAAIEFLKR